MIREALAGQRIAVTGSTGFLGTALVERLLRSVPDCQLVLVIRAGRRSTVDQRARREIFRNDAFNRLRAELGGNAAFDALVAERVTVVNGDVGRDGLGLDDGGREALRECGIVIHSAATVAFDSPLDAAVEVNLLGPTRIAHTLQSLGSPAHLVSVSTCYVAGNRRGTAPEQLLSESPFFLDIDWRAEVDAARRTRSDVDATSRGPDMLTRFQKEARRELGAAGTPLLAAKTEQRRTQWVRERLVEAGRARAVSLGWPDAYAYTKALGERALAEERGSVPVTIVRPSIIESALREPNPGWIRGFRMAEPIIISFARGYLKEFPGVPEGIVDVIPVDLVVGAVCTVAARGPSPRGDVDVVQVASGSANPLRFRRLVDVARGWFLENPLYDSQGQPIVVPDWRYTGRGRVQTQLRRATKTIGQAERVLQALPLRGKQAEFAARLEERKGEAERALSYVELYGAYAECEAVYGVERLLELSAETTDNADQDEFGFDPRVIEWDSYITDVHLPSIVTHARVRTGPGGSVAESRETRLRRQVLSADRHMAAFDLENTLIASNVVASYAWLATRRLRNDDRLRFVARTIAEAPRLLALDRRDRSDFLRYFYRRYEGASVAQIDEDALEMFSDLIITKSFPAAVRRVREHRALGHRTVLITGALDFVVAPLRPLFDDIICASLATTASGAYSGELTDVPPTGESRAQLLFDYCDANGLDPAESVAYADSTSDLPMLEAVGFPVAVNPETRLAAIARKRGWLVENWTKSSGGPGKVVPIAPRSATLTPARTT
jgi:HAD superfamily hydrolase (TIGR01490 family)